MVTMETASRVTFGRLIASYRARKRWTSAQLAREAGVSRKTISEIENDKRDPARIQASLFQKICHILEIPDDEIPRLWSGKGVTEPQPTYIGMPTRQIPVLNIVECGAWENLTDLDYPTGHGFEKNWTESRDLNAFYLIAHGDSMEPEIFEGDRLLVEPNKEAQNGDIVLAKVENGVTVKRLERLDGDTILLKPENRRHETIVVRGDKYPEFRCYPVTEIARKPRRV